jgi:UDP-N-acetyl-2-amino-2-deoxyglucuronate dehydrogenase
MMAKSFALIGAAGFIAPRHMKAINETGNVLTAAMDPYDGVGIMDSYFPDCTFFTQFERFDRFVDKQRRKGDAIEIISICSPPHDAHIRFGLRSHADDEKQLF